MNDEILMRRTFELARNGLGSTWPNPLVGCVIVKDGKIIGEGFHAQYGRDHAEVSALANCRESAQGATVYVNLEPCCHTNKQTPPCAPRLVEEKIKKVIICNLDPNPLVNGKGVELLRAHGIEVEHGLLATEGEKLNDVFFHAQKKRRPFIHLKLAATLDGRIALPNGQSQWITGEKAREFVHHMRSEHQVVMIGGESARRDNPSLNVRLPGYQGPQPHRAVISRSRSLTKGSKLLTDSLKDQTYVYESIEVALEDLFQKKLINVLLEGGPTLATDFLKKGLVDKLSLFLNPSILGAGPSIFSDLGITQLNERPRLTEMHSEWLGEDLLISGKFY